MAVVQGWELLEEIKNAFKGLNISLNIGKMLTDNEEESGIYRKTHTPLFYRYFLKKGIIWVLWSKSGCWK